MVHRHVPRRFLRHRQSARIKDRDVLGLRRGQGQGKPIVSSALPLRFAGVENQYFATLSNPIPSPAGEEDRLDRETDGHRLARRRKGRSRRPTSLCGCRPGRSRSARTCRSHSYRVFAGPKTSAEALAPLRRRGLAAYRKNLGSRAPLPVHWPGRHHAHPVPDLPGDRLGRPPLRRARRATMGSRSSC